MKVNFKAIMAKPMLSMTEDIAIDVTNDLGNVIYKDAKTINEDTLARKIYNSEGEIEITDAEAKFIVDNYVVMFPYWLQTALKDVLTA